VRKRSLRKEKPVNESVFGNLVERSLTYEGTLTATELRHALKILGLLPEKHKPWTEHYHFDTGLSEDTHAVLSVYLFDRPGCRGIRTELTYYRGR
jgi:hypothetical protein